MAKPKNDKVVDLLMGMEKSNPGEFAAKDVLLVNLNNRVKDLIDNVNELTDKVNDLNQQLSIFHKKMIAVERRLAPLIPVITTDTSTAEHIIIARDVNL